MEHFEMAVRLSKLTGAGFEQARDALERNNWGMAEAMRELESVGKTDENAKEESDMNTASEQAKGTTGSDTMDRIGSLVSDLVAKGNRNRLEVHRHEVLILKLPLTVLALVALIGFWLIFPGMLIGWFFGCRYSFQGPDIRSSQEYRHSSQTGTVT